MRLCCVTVTLLLCTFIDVSTAKKSGKGADDGAAAGTLEGIEGLRPTCVLITMLLVFFARGVFPHHFVLGLLDF